MYAFSTGRFSGIFTRPLTPGIDLRHIREVLDKAFDKPGGNTLHRTHGIVIVYSGRIIAERYAADLGYSADTPHYGWSMTKSVTAVLAGRPLFNAFQFFKKGFSL